MHPVVQNEKSTTRYHQKAQTRCGKTAQRHCTPLSRGHPCFSGRRKSYGWIRSSCELWDYEIIKILREKEV